MTQGISGRSRRRTRAGAHLGLLALVGALLAPVGTAAGATGPVTGTPTIRPPAAASPGNSTLSDQQAVAQALRSGQQVPIPAATTATSTLAANPDGSLSLTENSAPVRAEVGQSWRDLDATLVRNADGSISPTLTTDGLRLSGGGNGALATMRQATESLSLSLPVSLPVPTLSGATATYADVAPGVDLVVTASVQGGYSDVFVVHNAAAATSPALANLLKATVTTSTGLNVSADSAGNLTAATKDRTMFAAAAPTLWDSATDAAATTGTESATPNAAGAQQSPVATAGSAPTQSTSFAPGSAAHVGNLTPTLSGDTLSLSPDMNVLAGANTVYPAFIDPTWGPVSNSGWATVAKEYPTQSYWDKTPESYGYMAVGYSSELLAARTLINFAIPSSLNGATISAANLYAFNNYSGACPTSGQNQTVNVDAPTTTLSKSTATWDNWDTSGDVGSTIGSKSFAYGYTSNGTTSSCTFGGSSVGISLSTSTFTNDANSGKTTQTLALVAQNETNEYGWKTFDPSKAPAPTLTLTYDQTPTVSNLATSPNTSTIGRGSVYLDASVYSADPGNITLGVAFNAYVTGHPTEVITSSSSTPGTTGYLSAASGTTAVLNIPQSTLDADVTSSAFGGTGSSTSLAVSWTVTVSDGTLSSPASAVQSFTYSTAAPGQPTVNDAAGQPCGTSLSTQAYQIGTPATFAFAPNGGTATPTSYTYQINGSSPVSVPANGSGAASAAVTPSSGANILTVTAVAAGGNLGQSTTCIFPASTANPTADRDLTGDGTPDLLTVGTGNSSISHGLWEAAGQGIGGQVNTTPVDIGANGNGTAGDNAPTDFDGAQAITGQFTADNLQDVLIYYPTTGAGAVLAAPGDGTALLAQRSGHETTITGGILSDANGDNPEYLANAYNSAASGLDYPDLVGMSGDSSDGYQLNYYPNGDGNGAYAAVIPIDTYTAATDTLAPLTTPTGGTDWNNWTIASTQISGQTDIYLYDSSTGALYLWKNFTVVGQNPSSGGYVNTGCTSSTGPQFCAATYTPYLISSSWSPGTLQTLEAANVADNGVPDLWTVTTTGVTTAYLVTSLVAGSGTTPGSGTITAQTAQTLTTSTHSWALNDDTTTSGAVTAADDTTATADNLTGSATGAAWNSGDLFSPDIALDSTHSGDLTSTAAAIPLNNANSFTISAWAKPAALGGTLLSQEGSANSGFSLTPTSSGWQFALNTTAGATATNDTITGGTVQLGAWTHVTVTYNASSKVMNLYVDDVFVATGNHTAPTTGATGDFVIGANQVSSTLGSFYAGQIAEVQTMTGSALAPAQPTTAGSFHQSLTPSRLLDTRGTTGDTLTSGTTSPSTPVAANSTTLLQISGDTVTPSTSGSPTTIPATVTAVAIDLTATSESGSGFLTTYADGTQRPITSSTDYSASTPVTGYQIIPVGLDGKIAFFNSGSSTTHLLVDITGYYTSDPTLAGDQTFTPLTNSARALDTRTSIANTSLTSTGAVAANTTFTLQITGETSIPSNATAVAINLGAVGPSGSGFLEAYATGSAPTLDTALSYNSTSSFASMSADIPIGTGGTITISNQGTSSANILADVFGYFTTSTTNGDTYHTINPTRLVDTRSGIGGTTGAIASDGTYTVSQADTKTVTTIPNSVLATMLTVTQPSSYGNTIDYPTGASMPNTSNVNWYAGQTIANLALNTTNSSGQFSIYSQSPGTIQLIIDSSGFFAPSASVAPAPAHKWLLNDGEGSTAAGTVGGSSLALNTGYTWLTDTARGTVVEFDGVSGYGETSATAVNTASATGFTVSAWVNLTTLPSGNATAVSEDGTNNSPFYLQYNSGSWAFVISNNDTTTPTLDGPNGPFNVAADTWYHITGVYDATAHTAYIYVDGQLAGTQTGLTTFNASGNLNIGRDLYTGLQVDYFPGLINNVQTWNTALSAAQIASLN